MSVKNGMRPVHPGEILREELNELGLSANAMAKALGVPANRVTTILKGQRGGHGRYGATTIAVFWNNAACVVEPSKNLRTSPSGRMSRARI